MRCVVELVGVPCRTGRCDPTGDIDRIVVVLVDRSNTSVIRRGYHVWVTLEDKVVWIVRIHSLRLCEPDSIGLGIRVICVSVEGKQIGFVRVVFVTAHDVRTVILVEWIHHGKTESDCFEKERPLVS